MRTARLACFSSTVLLLSACLQKADTQAARDREDGANPRTAASIWKGLFCSNCSAHDNGYDWAEAKNITSPNDCKGTSEDFIRGCQAYASEQQLAQLVAAAKQGNAEAKLELETMQANQSRPIKRPAP